VAGHCGILAPLPGPDRRPPKPKCVNHFIKILVSQLTWTHRGKCKLAAFFLKAVMVQEGLFLVNHWVEMLAMSSMF